MISESAITALVFKDDGSGNLSVEAVIIRTGQHLDRLTKVAQDVLDLFAKAMNESQREKLQMHNPAGYEA